jgi:hypothetical protein
MRSEARSSDASELGAKAGEERLRVHELTVELQLVQKWA